MTAPKSVTANFDAVAGVGGNSSPLTFKLYGNVPNPFRTTTRLSFSLPHSGRIELTVFDLSGRIVKSLVSSEKGAGTFSSDRDGKDEAGNSVHSGVYLAVIRYGSLVEARRLCCMR